MQTRKVFHGSMEAELPESNWGVRRYLHFGTRQAAIERLARHIHDQREGIPRIVEFELPFPQSEILALQTDWKANGAVHLAHALSEHYKTESHSISQRFELIRSEFVDAKEYASPSEVKRLKGIAEKQLACVLDELGMRCVSYWNEVEDKGSLTYCSVIPFVIGQFVVSTPEHEELHLALQHVKKYLNYA